MKKLPTTIAQVLKIAKVKGDSLAVLNYKGKDKRMLRNKNTMLWELVVEVLNEGWKPKVEETAYELWWRQDKAPGFRLHSVDGDYWAVIVPSPQLFKTPKLGRHAVKHFFSLAKKVYAKEQ